jgi:ABC-2 type transport system permease protein
MNLVPVGFRTLLRKEIARFMSVPTQTVATPVITALLYLLIFGQALGSRISPFHGVPFVQFLIPGLIMMGVINHSFQNTSSSLIVSKYEGNIVDLLVAPMSHTEILLGYAGGGLTRGLLVGLVTYAAAIPFALVPVRHPLFLMAMVIPASLTFSLLGLVAAIRAQKFDQLSQISSFVVLPLTYLGGVFYSVDLLPPVFRSASFFNPLLYMVDGVRYGFLGVSDIDPAIDLAVVVTAAASLFAVSYFLLRSGYRLRN